MSHENKKPIIVRAKMLIKESPELKKITHKAVAGLSEAEAIERHIIGEYNRDGDKKEDEQEEG